MWKYILLCWLASPGNYFSERIDFLVIKLAIVKNLLESALLAVKLLQQLQSFASQTQISPILQMYCLK